VTLSLNFPAPIAVGHEIEVTEFEDVRPEKKRRGPGWNEPFRHPAVLDLTTGIRYLHEMHVRPLASLGGSTTPYDFPLRPSARLPVRRTYRARVTACALLMVEGVSNQHTKLVVEPVEPA
jgi:hypothetical protein